MSKTREHNKEHSSDNTNILTGYHGLANYVKVRLEDNSPEEERSLLACATLLFMLPRIRAYINDKKQKLPDFNIYELRITGEPVATISIARAPAFIARDIDMISAIRLFKISKCLFNFRQPLSSYIKITNMNQIAQTLIARYAPDIIASRRIIADAIKQKNTRARIYYTLRKKQIQKLASQDPLSTAVRRCLNSYEHQAQRYPLVKDAIYYASNGEPQTAIVDGEKSNTLFIEPWKGCPSKSLTIFDNQIMYVAHSIDLDSL